jgi:hypothetical protein
MWGGVKIRKKEAFERALVEAWNKLPKSLFERVADSMLY